MLQQSQWNVFTLQNCHPVEGQGRELFACRHLAVDLMPCLNNTQIMMCYSMDILIVQLIKADDFVNNMQTNSYPPEY